MAQNSGIAPPIFVSGFSRKEQTHENSSGINGRVHRVAGINFEVNIEEDGSETNAGKKGPNDGGARVRFR